MNIALIIIAALFIAANSLLWVAVCLAFMAKPPPMLPSFDEYKREAMRKALEMAEDKTNHE